MFENSFKHLFKTASTPPKISRSSYEDTLIIFFTDSYVNLEEICKFLKKTFLHTFSQDYFKNSAKNFSIKPP